jgi:hypothetical protein
VCIGVEGVAYIVANYFGLGGLDSPNYVALHGADAHMIMSHFAHIRNTAVEIINAVE